MLLQSFFGIATGLATLAAVGLLFYLNHQNQQGQRTRSSYHRSTELPRRLLSDYKASEENICSICLDSMGVSERYMQQCGHVFHQDCINQWAFTEPKCPNCRKPL